MTEHTPTEREDEATAGAQIADAIDAAFETDRGNAVDGLFAIADSINGLTRSIDRLGLGGAATSMGALEVLSMAIREGLIAIASSVDDIEVHSLADVA